MIHRAEVINSLLHLKVDASSVHEVFHRQVAVREGLATPEPLITWYFVGGLQWYLK